MVAYGKYNDGEMSDYIPTDDDLKAGFDGIPHFPEMSSKLPYKKGSWQYILLSASFSSIQLIGYTSC